MGRIAALLVLASAVFAGAAQAEPPVVTLETLIANPNLEAFKPVRIDGQLGACITVCKLCPIAMTRAHYDADKCIDVQFDGFAARGPSPNDEIAIPQLVYLQQVAFRYASVTLEAINDPGCKSKTRLTDNPGLDNCSAPALARAQVIAVLGRKSGRDGLPGMPLGHLVAAPQADADAMLAAYRAMSFDPHPSQMRAFQGVLDDPGALDNGITAVGYVCVCFAATCDGQWPQTFDAVDGLANPFRCHEMRKNAGRWLFVPGY